MTNLKPVFGAPETKYVQLGKQIGLRDENRIVGYASLFEATDQGGDCVKAGAYGASLKRTETAGRSIKMLWQHDPAQPIGVWDQIFEDKTGLYVSGRILPDVRAGAEALALLKAGAIDGLSIGYRTIKSQNTKGSGRALTEIDLWEVSLVTFPMLPEARVQKSSELDDDALARALADVFSSASNMLTRE
jgi:HK97 family phage prohead protease